MFAAGGTNRRNDITVWLVSHLEEKFVKKFDKQSNCLELCSVMYFIIEKVRRQKHLKSKIQKQHVVKKRIFLKRKEERALAAASC